MVEVEIAGFEDAHNLNADGRLTVEGDRGGVDQLAYKALQRDDVYAEVTALHESAEAVEQRVHPEEGLGGERVFGLVFLPGYRLGDVADDGCEPQQQAAVQFLERGTGDAGVEELP